MAPPPTPTSGLARTAAALTGCLAALTAFNGWRGSGGLLGAAHLLAGAIIAAAAVTAVWLWRRNSFESRLVAALVSTITLVGQVLIWLVGVPMSRSPHLSVAGLVVAVVSASILAVLATDARRFDGSADRDAPYAL